MNLVAAAGSPTRSPIRRAVLLGAALLLIAVGYAQPAHARYTAMAAPAGSPAPPAVRLTLPPPTGHSLGGATAAAVMFEDRRVRAGVNMDGAMWGPVVDAGLDRPFLLVNSQVHGRDNDESWVRFWAALRGWRLNLRLVGSGHNSFNDFQVLVPQMAGPVGIPPEDVVGLIGTIDPRRSILNQTAYLAAFVDLHLRSRDNHLLDGPSPRFPEMEFVP